MKSKQEFSLLRPLLSFKLVYYMLHTGQSWHLSHNMFKPDTDSQEEKEVLFVQVQVAMVVLSKFHF